MRTVQDSKREKGQGGPVPGNPGDPGADGENEAKAERIDNWLMDETDRSKSEDEKAQGGGTGIEGQQSRFPILTVEAEAAED